MSIFNKIFAKKAREIMDEIKEGERVLNQAELKLKKLKKASRARLLRSELAEAINDFADKIRYYPAFFISGSEPHKELEKSNARIETLLEILCALAEEKEKANAD